MTLKYFVSQGMVVFAMITLAATYLIKDKKKIIILGVVYNMFYGIQYFLLSAFSGFAMNIVNIIRNVWFYRNDVKGKKNGIVSLIGVFGLIFLFGQVSYQNIFTFVPMLATAIYSYSVWQDDLRIYRWLAIPMSLLWITYNTYSKSLFGVIAECILLIIEIVGIFRLKKDCKTIKGKAD